MLTPMDKIVKRTFDVIVSFLGLLATWWLILIAWIVASIETRSNGFFVQKRVGKEGKLFSAIKIKSMKKVEGVDTMLTAANDIRITRSGQFFRNSKIDELPQLINVFFGTMSFVGPRPDVEGYADMLEGEDSIVLSIRPGITGPASLKYKEEEEILSKQKDPKKYNDEVIWPDKVMVNKEYIENWSLWKDIQYIIKTIIG